MTGYCEFATETDYDGTHRSQCRLCGRVVISRTLPVMARCRTHTRPLATPGVATLATLQPLFQGGPGTELKNLLSFFGIYSVPENCSCNARAAIMDAWGCDECERRIDEIVGWLREEAHKRGLPFVDVAGRMLVRRAIKNARRAAES